VQARLPAGARLHGERAAGEALARLRAEPRLQRQLDVAQHRAVHAREPAPCVVGGGARGEAREHVRPVAAAVGEHVVGRAGEARVVDDRHEQRRALVDRGADEAARRDADDRGRVAVDDEGRPDHRRVGLELVRPVAVAQHRDRRRARALVVGREEPAERRRRPSTGKYEPETSAPVALTVRPRRRGSRRRRGTQAHPGDARAGRGRGGEVAVHRVS
jgi:hypothetical protein